MGASWQTDDQKAFFEQHLASYTRNLDEGTLKGFWPTIADEWFKRWPVGVTPPKLAAVVTIFYVKCMGMVSEFDTKNSGNQMS